MAKPHGTQMAILTISFLGVPESERSAIVSAVNIAARALTAELEWTTAAADISIVDVVTGQWPDDERAVIRYTSDRTCSSDADFSRPIRPTALMDALRAAVGRAQSRLQVEKSKASRDAAATAWYRGAPVEQSRTDDAKAKTASRHVIYRGNRLGG